MRLQKTSSISFFYLRKQLN